MAKHRRNLALLLLSVRELVRSRFQPVFREKGITEQQWRILRSLYEHEQLGVTEIADMCLIFRPSIVGILTRMEDMGLLLRASVAGDKRRVSLSLTRAGKKLVEQILPIFDEIYRNLERSIGKTKLDELYRVLDQVKASLSEDSVETLDARSKSLKSNFLRRA